MPTPTRPLLARRLPVSAEISAYLEDLIREELVPGDQLPPERELAEQLGVSRSSVREALRELAQHRVVERRPGRGTVVLQLGEDALTLRAALMAADADTAHVTELRRLVEPQVAGLAAARSTSSDVLVLERTLAAATADLSPSASLQLDLRFHAQLAGVARNPLLLTVCELATELSLEVRRRSHRTRAGRRSSVDGHRALAAAVAARDPDAAVEAMVAHLADVQRLVAP